MFIMRSAPLGTSSKRQDADGTIKYWLRGWSARKIGEVTYSDALVVHGAPPKLAPAGPQDRGRLMQKVTGLFESYVKLPQSLNSNPLGAPFRHG